MRILIDCDPGHDDAIAIMLALAHPEVLDILGITTVAGNQTVEKVTDNLLKVLDYLGCAVPVAMGSAAPLRRAPEPQPGAHGESGMDGPILPEAISCPVGQSADAFLCKTILAEQEPVTIVSLAPMTNLALLLAAHPEVKQHIESIRFMGGSIFSGNILSRAEFNIYHDPEAARVVFHSGVPLVMSGLEICGQARTYFREYEAFRAGGKASVLAYELLTFFSRYNRKRGKDYTTIFDAVPVVQLLEPSIFRTTRMNIDIETEGVLCRGMTAVDMREEPGIFNQIEVLDSVDRDRYQAVISDALQRLDGMLP